MTDIWSACLNKFEQELPAQQFNTWIKPLRPTPESPAAGELRLTAPNRFVLQWVRERYLQRIQELVRQADGPTLNVVLTLSETSGPVPTPAPDTIPDIVRAAGPVPLALILPAGAAAAGGLLFGTSLLRLRRQTD